jgi:hypothetical protein
VLIHFANIISIRLGEEIIQFLIGLFLRRHDDYWASLVISTTVAPAFNASR